MLARHKQFWYKGVVLDTLLRVRTADHYIGPVRVSSASQDGFAAGGGKITAPTNQQQQDTSQPFSWLKPSVNTAYQALWETHQLKDQQIRVQPLQEHADTA